MIIHSLLVLVTNFNLIDKKDFMKTVSLVLGSGGARGMAHIGVIRWLLEHNFEIKSISGCSAGALVGGAFAAGKLDEFESWAKSLKKVDLFSMLDMAWNRSGLVKGDKIINILTEIIGEVKIEDLPLKYTAMAADILNEKEVWLNSGSLFEAIRASISLPMFFTPLKINGVDLIDGGVLNPVPIAPTFSDDTDYIIAVNLGGKSEKIDIPKNKKIIINSQDGPFQEKVNQYLNKLKENIEEKSTFDWSVYDIANQAFDAMQSTIARQKLAAYPPDYLIEIPRNACGTFEIEKTSDMIEMGYKNANRMLASLVTK